MPEEHILVQASTMVPFIDSYQTDLAYKYHSFEFVSINYIPAGRTFLKSKLPKNESMIGRHLRKQQYEPGT